mgnify:CR=1 FL=1
MSLFIVGVVAAVVISIEEAVEEAIASRRRIKALPRRPRRYTFN